MPLKGAAGAPAGFGVSAAAIAGGAGPGFTVDGWLDEVLPAAGGREAGFDSTETLGPGGMGAGLDSRLLLRFSTEPEVEIGLFTGALRDTGCVPDGSAAADLLAELDRGCVAADAAAGLVFPSVYAVWLCCSGGRVADDLFRGSPGERPVTETLASDAGADALADADAGADAVGDPASVGVIAALLGPGLLVRAPPLDRSAALSAGGLVVVCSTFVEPVFSLFMVASSAAFAAVRGPVPWLGTKTASAPAVVLRHGCCLPEVSAGT